MWLVTLAVNALLVLALHLRSERLAEKRYQAIDKKVYAVLLFMLDSSPHLYRGKRDVAAFKKDIKGRSK